MCDNLYAVKWLDHQRMIGVLRSIINEAITDYNDFELQEYDWEDLLNTYVGDSKTMMTQLKTAVFATGAAIVSFAIPTVGTSVQVVRACTLGASCGSIGTAILKYNELLERQDDRAETGQSLINEITTAKSESSDVKGLVQTYMTADAWNKYEQTRGNLLAAEWSYNELIGIGNSASGEIIFIYGEFIYFAEHDVWIEQ